MVTSHFSYFNLVMCSHSSETPPFVDMLTMIIIIMITLCNPNNYTIFIVINAQKVLLQTLCLIVIVLDRHCLREAEIYHSNVGMVYDKVMLSRFLKLQTKIKCLKQIC